MPNTFKDENVRRPKPVNGVSRSKKQHYVREYEEFEDFGSRNGNVMRTQSLERTIPKYVCLCN